MRDFLKSMLAKNTVINLQFKVIKLFKPKFPNISRYNLVTILETEIDYSNLVTILETEIDYSFSLPEPKVWRFL